MSEIKAIDTRRRRYLLILFVLLVLSLFLLVPLRLQLGDRIRNIPNSTTFGQAASHSRRSLNLNRDQCKVAFPGLTKYVDETAALGSFVLKPAGESGLVQVRIKDGQMYFFRFGDDTKLSPELRDARTATLHQLHRALITSPEPLPDTILSINIHDQPFGTSLSYSRPAFASPTAGGPPIKRIFLMPHFSFWAWPLPFVGSFARAADAIASVESTIPFRSKDSRVVWRGTTGFEGAHYPKLREDLLAVAKGKDWADVEELRWPRETGKASNETTSPGSSMPANALMIEEFCRHKYIVHTEGVTYSGRFQFLQLCKSVVLAPPLAWMQHVTHLVRPVFSSDLIADLGSNRGAWESSEGVRKAWPTRYKPHEANMVFVSPDWSDLERTVRWLEENPAVAEGIASRQRELFSDGGYLSPAAEVCYWRALIRGWSEAVEFEDGDWRQVEEVSWELFSLGQ